MNSTVKPAQYRALLFYGPPANQDNERDDNPNSNFQHDCSPEQSYWEPLFQCIVIRDGAVP